MESIKFHEINRYHEINMKHKRFQGIVAHVLIKDTSGVTLKLKKKKKKRQLRDRGLGRSSYLQAAHIMAVRYSDRAYDGFRTIVTHVLMQHWRVRVNNRECSHPAVLFGAHPYRYPGTEWGLGNIVSHRYLST